MPSERPLLVLAILAALGLASGAVAQPRPRPGTSRGEASSLFGGRTLGFPVSPKPRYSGGNGAFGPRPNFGRGFSTPLSFSLWDDLAPVPGAGSQDRLQLGPGAGSASQVAPPRPGPLGQPAEFAAQARQRVGETGPLAGQAEQTAVQAGPAGHGGPQPETAIGQPGQVAALPGELGTQSEGMGVADGEWLAGGGTAQLGTAAQGAPTSRRPGYRWNTNTIRRLPANAVLAQRLQDILRDRLRSPLEVTIRDQTAVLRGVVATERDRVLAGHLARFEPGIRVVENELTLASSSSDSPPVRLRVLASPDD